MKKTIQSMSAMLTMLALVCASFVSFTACSDDNELLTPPHQVRR